MSEASVGTQQSRQPWTFGRIGTFVGTPLRGLFGYFGDHALLLGSAFAWLFRRPFRLRLFLEQMEFVGVGSLPIILLVGFFSGAVSAQQTIRALSIFGRRGSWGPRSGYRWPWSWRRSSRP